MVIEYQQHRLICPHCRTSPCGTLPGNVDGRTGPVLAGLLVLMTSWFRTSRQGRFWRDDSCWVVRRV